VPVLVLSATATAEPAASPGVPCLDMVQNFAAAPSAIPESLQTAASALSAPNRRRRFHRCLLTSLLAGLTNFAAPDPASVAAVVPPPPPVAAAPLADAAGLVPPPAPPVPLAAAPLAGGLPPAPPVPVVAGSRPRRPRRRCRWRQLPSPTPQALRRHPLHPLRPLRQHRCLPRPWPAQPRSYRPRLHLRFLPSRRLLWPRRPRVLPPPPAPVPPPSIAPPVENIAPAAAPVVTPVADAAPVVPVPAAGAIPAIPPVVVPVAPLAEAVPGFPLLPSSMPLPHDDRSAVCVHRPPMRPQRCRANGLAPIPFT